MVRLPPGEDWKDHAIPCPNCDEPVLKDLQHWVAGDLIDDGWWKCDKKE